MKKQREKYSNLKKLAPKYPIVCFYMGEYFYMRTDKLPKKFPWRKWIKALNDASTSHSIEILYKYCEEVDQNANERQVL